MDVGYKLYELRRSLGLTQAELGRRVGVSEAAIRAYETGKRRPKQAHLERIADALGVMPEAIADYGIDDVDEAIHLLFRLGEDWKLRPVEVVDGHFFLESHDQDIFNAVKAWGRCARGSRPRRSPSSSASPGGTATRRRDVWVSPRLLHH